MGEIDKVRAWLDKRNKHIGKGANAEECRACASDPPDYPWICPGEPDE